MGGIGSTYRGVKQMESEFMRLAVALASAGSLCASAGARAEEVAHGGGSAPSDWGVCPAAQEATLPIVATLRADLTEACGVALEEISYPAPAWAGPVTRTVSQHLFVTLDPTHRCPRSALGWIGYTRSELRPADGSAPTIVCAPTFTSGRIPR